MNPKDWYFSIQQEDESSVVILTNREYWDSKGFLQDTNEPDVIAEFYGLERRSDSTYRPPVLFENHLLLLKHLMEKAGFIWNPLMSTKFRKRVLAQ